MGSMMRLPSGFIHHVYSVGGQVAAAAPNILIAAILARTVSLLDAGHFVVISAYAVVLFTTFFFGFIYYVSIDRFSRFSAWDFTITRFLAVMFAGGLLLIAAKLLHIPYEIALLVLLLRIADSASDLVWGLELCVRPGDAAVRNYAFLNSAKIITILVPLTGLVIGLEMSPLQVLIMGALLACVLCWGRLIVVTLEFGRPPHLLSQFSRSTNLVRHAAWYAVAGVVSALVSNSPRLVLERTVSGELLGVIAVTLSFSTIYAMAFMSVWLRWFPRLSREEEGQRHFGAPLGQSIALAIALIFASISVVPLVLSFIFGFDHDRYQVVCAEVLISTVVFSLAMNITNFFKLTRYVYLESAAVISGVLIGLLFLQQGGVAGFLLASGISIFAICAVAFLLIRRRGTAARKVIFLRFTARPVSRVVRMMTVAREAGYDVLFIGAYREKGLPRETLWEGLPVRRLGPHFPLLNGRGLFRYVYCVLACNVFFFLELWREAPSVVHASDVETMPAAALYRILTSRRVVFNIHDNLAQRYALPSSINALLNVIEGLAVLAAHKALVPETFRRDALPPWCRSKVSVIRNLPLKEMRAAPPVPFEGGRIRIFYGGWLDWQRGLRALLALAEDQDIEVRIAGEGSSEIINEIRASRATYLGFLSSEDVYRETEACHYVPVLYDPSRLINRYSASNKLAETLSLGRPLIINQEMEVARDLGDGPGLLKVEYEKAGLIAPRLRALLADSQAYAGACANARIIYETWYDQNVMRMQSIDALFGVAGGDGK